MTDPNVVAAHRLFDEPAIGELEERVLGALEENDRTYAAHSATQEALGVLFSRVVSAWVFDGAQIDVLDRTKGRPRCLVNVGVGTGNARAAHRFRIVGEVRVRVAADGSPEMSSWICNAIPLSPKTGREMNANTPNGHRQDGTVTLTGFVCVHGYSELHGAALMQAERDEFIRMVADAEAILTAREAPAPDESPALEPAPRG